MTRRQFTVPFADSGTKVSIPTPAQPDGSVSLEEGYTFDYERELGVDAEAKSIERSKINALFNEITSSISEIQQYGVAIWSAEGAPYDIFASVRHLGRVWSSSISANSAEPGDDNSWADISVGASSLQFATDAAMVAGAPINGPAISSWEQYAGKTVSTVRNNSIIPAATAPPNIQNFLIRSGAAPSGLGIVNYDLGDGFYAIRSRQSAGILIDWFDDFSGAGFIAANAAFLQLGYNPVVLAPQKITLTDAGSSYTVNYWRDGLTIEFNSTAPSTTIVLAQTGSTRPVTFLINDDDTILQFAINASDNWLIKGKGQRVTLIPNGNYWVIQNAGIYLHPEGHIGDTLSIVNPGDGVVSTVGPTGSGADFIWDALDGLGVVKTLYITSILRGFCADNDVTGNFKSSLKIASVTTATTPSRSFVSGYNPASGAVADSSACTVTAIPQTSDGIFYVELDQDTGFSSPNGTTSVALVLSGYEY